MPDEWFRPESEEPPGSGDRAHSPEQEPEVPAAPDGDRDDEMTTSKTSGRVIVVKDDTGPSVTVGRPPMHASGPTSRRRSFPVWILVVAAALVVGLVLGTFLTESSDGFDGVPAPATDPSSVAADSASAPRRMDVKALTGLRATASCISDPALDSNHKVIRYDADNLVDNKPQTAWRCNGSAQGQQITVSVPKSTRIVGVGMINGYAKKEEDVDLYPQYRRVRSVRWSLPDGTWFIQDFTDDDESPQTLMIAPHKVSGDVVVTIISTTEPGRRGEPTRDSLLISEVQLLVEA